MNELEQYLGQLAKAHGFTLEQLEMNRQGQLHPTQVARSKGVAGAVFAFVLCVLCLVGGTTGAVLYYDDVRKPLERLDRNALVGIGGGTTVATAFFGWIGLSALASRRRRIAAFATGRVEVVTAPVVKSGIQGRGGAASTWRLTFGDRHFSVMHDTWELVTHGATYRAYVVNGELLSLEPAKP